MADGKEKISIVELEPRGDGPGVLHLRIPLPGKAFWIALAFIALVLLLRSGLVDLDTIRQLLELLTSIATAGA